MLLQNIFFTAGVSEGKGGEGKGWCGGARVCQGSPIVPCIYLNDQIQSSYFHPTNRIERKTRYAKYSLFLYWTSTPRRFKRIVCEQFAWKLEEPLYWLKVYTKMQSVGHNPVLASLYSPASKCSLNYIFYWMEAEQR